MEMVSVHFVDPNQGPLPVRRSVRAPIGSSIVDVAKEHGIDIHAACGQKLQCATCHVILTKPFHDLLPPVGAREGDMLELAATLTDTSRLGCQLRLTPELDGIECTLPDSAAKNTIRMSLNQPRPRIETQWTAVPANVPRMRPRSTPSRGDQDMVLNVQQQIDDQRNLALRLEQELRQLRAAAFASGSRIPGAADARVKTDVAKNASAEGKEADDGDEGLAKFKKELERTRVDVERLGRRASFDDVIGLDSAKRALREALIWPAIADPALFSGVRGSPKGLLLYGPPGCGKTMLARAAAAELVDHAAFFHVRPGDVMSKFYGESQKRVQALEELVRGSSPAVIFLDEVDSLLGSRDNGNTAEHHRATTNALLEWMDGFGTGEERVFFLGATNRAEAIDEAALRRFGEAVEVGMPSLEARLSLIRHLVCEKAASQGHRAAVSEEDISSVAKRCDGFSLADVDRLVRRAFLEVLRDLPSGVRAGLHPADVPPVAFAHFEAAFTESSGSSALREMLKQRAAKRAKM